MLKSQAYVNRDSLSGETLAPIALSRKEKFFIERFERFTVDEQAAIVANLCKPQRNQLLSALPFDPVGLSTEELTYRISTLPGSGVTATFKAAVKVRDPLLEKEIAGAIEKQLLKYYPGIIPALRHIQSGGYIGILTSRSRRKGIECVLKQINEFFGISVDDRLIFCVNDPDTAALFDLKGKTAQRKLQVLLGLLGPKKFDRMDLPGLKNRLRLTFVDDEAVNIDPVRDITVIRNLVKKVFPDKEEKAATHEAEGRVQELRGRATERLPNGDTESSKELARRQEDLFVSSLSRHLRRDPRPGDDTYKRLFFRHTEQIDLHREWDLLVKSLDGEPSLEDTDHLMMLDMDGTILELDGHELIKSRMDPEAPALAEISREQLKRKPSSKWLEETAMKFGLTPDKLFIDYSQFEQDDLIIEQIKSGLEGNRMWKRRHRGIDLSSGSCRRPPVR